MVVSDLSRTHRGRRHATQLNCSHGKGNLNLSTVVIVSLNLALSIVRLRSNDSDLVCIIVP
jgi:hypothetical protein